MAKASLTKTAIKTAAIKTQPESRTDDERASWPDATELAQESWRWAAQVAALQTTWYVSWWALQGQMMTGAWPGQAAWPAWLVWQPGSEQLG